MLRAQDRQHGGRQRLPVEPVHVVCVPSPRVLLPSAHRLIHGQWAGLGEHRTPHVGAAMVFRAGQLGANRRYGHVAVVERVNSDGSVLISECGASLQGVAQWRTIYNAGNFQYVHY